MAIFGHSKFIPVSLGKIVRKKFVTAILAILNFFPSFLEKLLEIGNGIYSLKKKNKFRQKIFFVNFLKFQSSCEKNEF